MRAWLLHRPAPVDQRPLRLEEVPDPLPGPGEVAIAVEACGVCHTDLHVVTGELEAPRYPVIPGHQVVGTVAAVGEPASASVRVGDRVGVMWLHRACGSCDACLRGQENLCEAAQFTGFHVPGGYAERMVAPASFVVPLPRSGTPAQIAPLLCAGVIGYRSLRRAGLEPGERLALFGFGASAHLVLQVARHQGCEVYVFSRSLEHRRLARELGAAWTGAAGEQPPKPCDRAITFAPAGRLIPEALKVLRPGGVLAVNAIHLDRVPEFPYGLLWGEREIRSVANVTRQDAREFFALLRSAPVHTQVEVFDFMAANEALAALQAGRISGAAALAL